MTDLIINALILASAIALAWVWGEVETAFRGDEQ